jgi:hypothetical protein
MLQGGCNGCIRSHRNLVGTMVPSHLQVASLDSERRPNPVAGTLCRRACAAKSRLSETFFSDLFQSVARRAWLELGLNHSAGGPVAPVATFLAGKWPQGIAGPDEDIFPRDGRIPYSCATPMSPVRS